MSGNTPAVAGILPELRAVLLGLPAEHRQSVAAFWVKVRQEIRALENAGPSSSSPIVAPSRPTSSASVARERRQLIDNTIADAIPEEEPSNAALTVLSLLPSGWIRSRVQSYPKRSNSLGCWLHTSQPAHKEYVKDNMRNTAHPDTKRPLGIQLYVHQVALAGKDGGSAEILLCGRGGSHEVRFPSAEVVTVG
ncbi:hypothetical protein CDV36_016526 [Fusarium kuroshium]|uniref:Uncharacterized protein n=1 Tax=Fusarium kuroshium TaxID=2010991 RepID=A0A3M2QLF9_9HYPO|nr:hypothetical protein CDV36_016526 [Fusarium kuroshium]